MTATITVFVLLLALSLGYLLGTVFPIEQKYKHNMSENSVSSYAASLEEYKNFLSYDGTKQ